MDLDGPEADAQFAARLLARRTRRDLIEHIDLALGQELAAGETRRTRAGGVHLLAPTPPRVDSVADTAQDALGVERLLDEIERAVLDRLHRHRDVALSGDDQDRRRVRVGIELSQNVEARTARHVDV